MLDLEIKEQLKAVFADLTQTVTLLFDESDNSNQAELIDMLSDVASTSPRLEAHSSGQKSDCPSFEILVDGRASGIKMRGIPGGHEFTSLIVAILNSAGRGKMPDAGLVARIRALRGPVRIKTYISLTCENCPDVVQALNQMALSHADFHHEMVDAPLRQTSALCR